MKLHEICRPEKWHLLPGRAAIQRPVVHVSPHPTALAVEERNAVEAVVEVQRNVAVNPACAAVDRLEQRAAVIEGVVLGGNEYAPRRGRGDAANLQVGGQRALHAPLGKRTRSRCCQEARAAQQGPKGERAAASGLASREILAAGAGHGVWLKLMERQVANGLRRTCSFEHCCAGPVSCVSDSNDPFGST